MHATTTSVIDTAAATGTARELRAFTTKTYQTRGVEGNLSQVHDRAERFRPRAYTGFEGREFPPDAQFSQNSHLMRFFVGGVVRSSADIRERRNDVSRSRARNR